MCLDENKDYINNHFPQVTPEKWMIVFFIPAIIYIACGTFYIIFGSGMRQEWDDPEKDDQYTKKNGRLESIKTIAESQH